MTSKPGKAVGDTHHLLAFRAGWAAGPRESPLPPGEEGTQPFHCFVSALLCDFSKTDTAKVQPTEPCRVAQAFARRSRFVGFVVRHKPLLKTSNA